MSFTEYGTKQSFVSSGYKMVGDRSRVILNFDLSKIIFVHL